MLDSDLVISKHLALGEENKSKSSVHADMSIFFNKYDFVPFLFMVIHLQFRISDISVNSPLSDIFTGDHSSNTAIQF